VATNLFERYEGGERAVLVQLAIVVI